MIGRCFAQQLTAEAAPDLEKLGLALSRRDPEVSDEQGI